MDQIVIYSMNRDQVGRIGSMLERGGRKRESESRVDDVETDDLVNLCRQKGLLSWEKRLT